MPVSFSKVTRDIKRRAARAYVSRFAPRDEALRTLLTQAWDAPVGQPGSLLGQPVFEAMFKWKQAEASIEELRAPRLNRTLVTALDQAKEQAFKRDWKPHSHQAQAWQQLLEAKKSVLVSSGTGSGKTECFLVPILHDLAEEAEKQKGPLVGVRALMLYPLNALINSQRDRLKAWMDGLGEKARFALYNGDTPEETRPAFEGSEVKDRKTIRDTAPAIMVTNATMLEYMLIRPQDQAILQKSQGTLRWVVLDEAHTYLGSQAAELSLLIRRMLMAFGVSPNEVRFVATSATIGKSGDTETKQKLRSFLASIGGISEEQVVVIEGEADKPLLQTLDAYDKGLPQVDSYDAFLKSEPVRTIYEALREGPKTAAQLSERLKDKGQGDLSNRDVIELLERATQVRRPNTSEDEGETFLRLRAHLFSRLPTGLWCCSNRFCKEKPTPEGTEAIWPWGKVFHARTLTCNACESKVFEAISCQECGESYLAATKKEFSLEPRQAGGFSSEEAFIDAFDGESSADESRADTPQTQTQFLLSRHEFKAKTKANAPKDEVPQGHVWGYVPKEGGLTEPPASPTESDDILWLYKSQRCPCCSHQDADNSLFLPYRIGRAFALSVIQPTLLEQAQSFHENAQNLPFRGRRLIAFTDSRQGVADVTLRIDLDAQHNYVRSFTYHQIWANAKGGSGHAEIEKLKDEIQELEPLNSDGRLDSYLKGKKEELVALEAKLAEPPRVSMAELRRSWNGALDKGFIENAVRETYTQERVFELLWARELARRSKKSFSLESMGLASIRYPALEKKSIPTPLKSLNLIRDDAEWRDLLKLCMDFVIRRQQAVTLDESFTRWNGQSFYAKSIRSPRQVSTQGEKNLKQVDFPKADSKTGFVKLLRVCISSDEELLAEVLHHLWEDMVEVLTQVGEGYQLDLFNPGTIELAGVRQAWICPVTRRVVDTVLRGKSIYSAGFTEVDCEAVTFPDFPHAFQKNAEGLPTPEVFAWLESNADLQTLRRKGVWSELSDRVVLHQGFIRIEEHSAQRQSEDLQKIEARFKKGEVNIISCSTTMEMGIDIGGISIVGMNNVPPSPANFLQRAGRAGRRNESRALSVTLCQETPHSSAVFHNPLWPFTTPIHVPRVLLSSDQIVQRHVNAFFLASFLNERVPNTLKFHTAPFFLADQEQGALSYYDRFMDWLDTSGPRLSARIQTLLAHANLSLSSTIPNAKEQLRTIYERWRLQVRVQEEQMSAEERSLMAKGAIQHQLKRLKEEYLVGFLAREGWLPSYGFPTSLVTFLNEYKGKKPKGYADHENPGKKTYSQDYPTRNIAIALSEYAPGSNLILDKKIYRSDGLSLHWKIPAAETDIGESQRIGWASKCHHCGSVAFDANREKLKSCGCQAASGDGSKSKSDLEVIRYIEPSGMATSIINKPDNNLERRKKIPSAQPWISGKRDDWDFASPEMYYRASSNGMLFHHNKGEHGYGYALCLACGRAESEFTNKQGAESKLPAKMVDHFRLRSLDAKNNGRKCEQSLKNPWNIARHMLLGAQINTDIFELFINLNYLQGSPEQAKPVARTVGFALRTALSRLLGLNEREIGCDVIQIISPIDKQPACAIVLYDTASGGAGLVTQTGEHLAYLLKEARRILECPYGCDKACHGCLLDYESERHAHELDRTLALKYLSETFIDSLGLEEADKHLGPNTIFETRPLLAALRKSMEGAKAFDVYVHRAMNDWQMNDSDLLKALESACQHGLSVRLILQGPAPAPHMMNALDCELLAKKQIYLQEMAQKYGGSFAIYEGQGNLGELVRIATAHDVTRWAPRQRHAEAYGFHDEWGKAESGYVSSKDPVEAMADIEGLKAWEHKTNERSLLREVKFTASESKMSINHFGDAFWNKAKALDEEFKKKLEKKDPIKSVVLTDRYLRSPLNLRLAYEVLRTFLKLGSNHKSSLRVRTKANLKPTEFSDYGTPRLWHDFKSPDLLREYGNAVFENLATFELCDALQHCRSIDIEWEDGTKFSVRPDQGVTFMRIRKSPLSDLDVSRFSKDSGRKLRDIGFDIEMQDSDRSYETVFHGGFVA